MLSGPFDQVMQVEIEYCADCGGVGMAVEVRDRLREACGGAIDAIDLTPVADGSFRVRAGGQQVFSTDDETYDPNRAARAACNAVL